MKKVIASAILLIAVIVVLVLPWYRVTTSQVVPQTSSSYTVEFEVATTGQMESVYTLPNRVVTEYSQTTVPFYTILGVLASALILVLLTLLLVLSILVDRGMITVPTNRRKRRKR